MICRTNYIRQTTRGPRKTCRISRIVCQIKTHCGDTKIAGTEGFVSYGEISYTPETYMPDSTVLKYLQQKNAFKKVGAKRLAKKIYIGAIRN